MVLSYFKWVEKQYMVFSYASDSYLRVFLFLSSKFFGKSRKECANTYTVSRQQQFSDTLLYIACPHNKVWCPVLNGNAAEIGTHCYMLSWFHLILSKSNIGQKEFICFKISGYNPIFLEKQANKVFKILSLQK